MIEPVALSDFFLSFFSASMIIFTAALYAGLYAWAEIARNKTLHYWAIAVYSILLALVTLFSHINHLHGHWLLLTLSMAIGYWWMPRLIWRLCTVTHDHDVTR